MEEVLSLAKEKGVPLYTIGSGPKIYEEDLRELSGQTGGSFFKAGTPDKLLVLYQTIAEQLKNQYILSFKSTLEADNNWHGLKITIEDSTGEKVSVEKEYIASVGPGVSPDVIMASVEAILQGMNRLMDIDK